MKILSNILTLAKATISAAGLNATRLLYLPDKDGTLAVTSDLTPLKKAVRTALLLDVPPILDSGIKDKALSSLFTFARGSTATHYKGRGEVVTETAGTPRFNFDCVTKALKGLLIEPSDTNLLLYSEDLSNAYWGKTNASFTANATLAPDGTLTADKLTENSTTSVAHYVDRTVAGTVNTNRYVRRMFIKTGERSQVSIQTYSSPTTSKYVNINITNFFTGTYTQSVAAGCTLHSVKIERTFNDFFCVEIEFTLGTAETSIICRTVILSGGFGTYAGTVGYGLYIWGQELKALSGSYIPTVASTVTRSADTCTLSGTNFSGIFNPSGFGVYVEFYGNTVGTTTVLEFSNASGDRIVLSNFYVSFTIEIFIANVSTRALLLPPISSDTLCKVAITWDNSNTLVCTASNSVYIDTVDLSGTVLPVPTQLTVGHDSANSNHLNKEISDLVLFSRRLTDAELTYLITN